MTAGDQTNQDSSVSDAKHDGTQSFPRTETVLVAMQQNDARQSRDECLRGEHSSKLVSRGSSCHRTHDVTKGHMTRSVPSTTTLEKELSGCSKIVEIHTNADRCVHTDSAKAVDDSSSARSSRSERIR